MQLSELRPEAVRMIMKLISAARERMNGHSGEETVLPQDMADKVSYVKLDKTPKCFPKSNDS